MPDEEKIEHVFAEIKAGRLSFRGAAKQLGIPKSTLHDKYERWLVREIRELESKFPKKQKSKKILKTG
ncbi:MAG: helix-turn-helix domain-containing protein [Candidatus Hodarchaeaceae archaeon]|nr:helix-turn-helix domain-containing protein [Candidatus Hodarchaeaceae archaeon]